MSNEIKTRPLTPTEQKYTYAQSMQLEGQTGTIGHLRGDFATTGYGFYTTWFDTRPQWKSDEFKADLDTVINALREDKGLLHNRYDMSAFARHFPESAIKGNYCTEYGFRVDTEKHAFLLRCNPTKGDYNFYCYCYVKEWLDKHIQKAEQGIRFIDPQYKELFRIPDGGKVIVTTSWGEVYSVNIGVHISITFTIAALINKVIVCIRCIRISVEVKSCNMFLPDTKAIHGYKLVYDIINRCCIIQIDNVSDKEQHIFALYFITANQSSCFVIVCYKVSIFIHF